MLWDSFSLKKIVLVTMRQKILTPYEAMFGIHPKIDLNLVLLTMSIFS